MGLQKIILNIILKIEYLFVSMLKIQPKRIAFISLESEQLESDMKLIYQQLDQKKYDIKLCLIHYHKDLWGQFLYFLNCMKQLYIINTSKCVILHDNNYVVSNFKKEEVKVLQLWHACGAIKKFGNVIDRKYHIENYDYVLSTSSYWKQPYSESFSVNIDQILPIGMPRTDELFDLKQKEEYRNKLYARYPQLQDKKIILYAPTFRGNIYQGFSTIPFNVSKLMDDLGEDYVFLYKFHPLLGNIQLAQHGLVFNMNHEDIHQLFCIADYLISDYSSVVFDFMILEKPIIFFVPDLKEYIRDLGVFVDITTLPYPICNDEDEIKKNILQYPTSVNDMIEMKNQFFDLQDGKSTKRVVQLIEMILENKSTIY